MQRLTNPRADRVKAYAKLRMRSHRVREGLFLVEGPQAVREALEYDAGQTRSDRSIVEFFTTEWALEKHTDIADLVRRSGMDVTFAEPDVIAALADTATPQGMVAVCRMIDAPLSELLAGSPRLLAVLARIQDPGNAGTILRAADSAGAAGVVFLPETVDPYNPKVVRSTAGSLFHVPFALAGEDWLAEMRRAGLTILAADGYGETDLDDLLDEAHTAGAESLLAKPTAWLFGNEAQGLSEEEEQGANARVRVPIYGKAESLNVSTAATVCLYASARAQRLA
jgi:TrmH family RNA methyltransferase